MASETITTENESKTKKLVSYCDQFQKNLLIFILRSVTFHGNIYTNVLKTISVTTSSWSCDISIVVNRTSISRLYRRMREYISQK